MDSYNIYSSLTTNTIHKLAQGFIESGLEYQLHNNTELYAHYTFALYLLGDPLFMPFVDAPIEELTFVDYKTWIWIRPLLLLKARLNKIEAIVTTDKIWQAQKMGNEMQIKSNIKAFLRFLNGETLDLLSLDKATQEQDKTQEAYLRVTLTMKLIIITTMGGGDNFSVDDAEKMLQENRLQFQKLYLFQD